MKPAPRSGSMAIDWESPEPSSRLDRKVDTLVEVGSPHAHVTVMDYVERPGMIKNRQRTRPVDPD